MGVREEIRARTTGVAANVVCGRGAGGSAGAVSVSWMPPVRRYCIFIQLRMQLPANRFDPQHRPEAEVCG
jgi:hypothetical protein